MAASIGDVMYDSTSSAEAPAHEALTVSLGSSMLVRVASASRVNDTPPASRLATAVASTTAGRRVAQ